MKPVPVAHVVSLFAIGALSLVAQPVLSQTRLLGTPVGGVVEAPAAEQSGAEGQPVFGRSGVVRAAVVRALESLELNYLARAIGPEDSRYRWAPVMGAQAPGLLGEALAVGPLQAPGKPGIWQLEGAQTFAGASRPATPAFITVVPFAQKRGGYLNGYHIGTYPAERTGRGGEYAPPSGFIEVTPENQDFAVSEHFKLRHFLTKDQGSVWPKYLALDLTLIDKLELVLQELNAMGVRAERMHVMSGFRTPQYNGPGGDGRAALSRHTYGDAADVWVDSDSNGYMDDLNGDGRSDIQDARIMLRAVDRVERRFPELVGGAGVYVATSAHGPFIHIDTRGNLARW